MRIVIPGGSGQVGTLLARHLFAHGHQVTVLSRHPRPASWHTEAWDGVTEGPWVASVQNADAVIHLSGRTINCRYTPEHRKELLESRTVPTRLLGKVIAAANTPPSIWLNASTATLYRHALDRAQDEYTGEPADLPGERGTHEPANLPETWSFSANIGHEWEEALASVPTPKTRKIRLRTTLVMSPDPGGVFSVLSRLARLGLAGPQGNGKQYVSWMHDLDYCRATDLLLEHPEITDETDGIVNMASPDPLPNRDFNRILRHAWGRNLGLPATSWMMEVGAFFMRTESELVLKSRRVTPGVLLRHGFEFLYPDWTQAAANLVRRSRALRH